MIDKLQKGEVSFEETREGFVLSRGEKENAHLLNVQLSKKHDCLPVSIYEKEHGRTERTDIEYTEAEDNIYYPAKITRTVEKNGQPYRTMYVVVDKKSLKINQYIDTTIFDYRSHIRAGCRIHDNKTDRTTTYGKSRADTKFQWLFDIF